MIFDSKFVKRKGVSKEQLKISIGIAYLRGESKLHKLFSLVNEKWSAVGIYFINDIKEKYNKPCKETGTGNSGSNIDNNENNQHNLNHGIEDCTNIKENLDNTITNVSVINNRAGLNVDTNIFERDMDNPENSTNTNSQLHSPSPSPEE